MTVRMTVLRSMPFPYECNEFRFEMKNVALKIVRLRTTVHGTLDLTQGPGCLLILLHCLKWFISVRVDTFCQLRTNKILFNVFWRTVSIPKVYKDLRWLANSSGKQRKQKSNHRFNRSKEESSKGAVQKMKRKKN